MGGGIRGGGVNASSTNKRKITHQDLGPASIREVRAHLEHGLVLLPKGDLLAAEAARGGGVLHSFAQKKTGTCAV
jgi:hypothetical protein